MVQDCANAGNKTKVVQVWLREYLKDFDDPDDIVAGLRPSRP